MPLIVWSYPRGEAIEAKGGPGSFYAIDYAARMAMEMGADDQLLSIAKQLEAVALSDPYFIDHKLYPNVDFYSGLIYRALGFPSGMFTVLFAIGRLPGWIAQWREMMSDPGSRIGRPRQLYIGAPERPYVPVAER